MRFHESHFWYNKSQRNGILLLAALLTVLQVVLYFTDELFAPGQTTENMDELLEIERQLDSMARKSAQPQDYRIYPFNPNYISDYKGYLLGMTPEEIDRLLLFREQGKFLRSASDFQKVTGVSDSLFDRISIHFKFPTFKEFDPEPRSRVKSEGSKKSDLNSASYEDLQKVKGIGPVLSKRIISYRSLLGGFSFEDQLYEVYHLPEQTIANLLLHFEIRQRPQIEKLNINTASFKQILNLPYIDYELTRKIMAFRSEEKIITDLTDLKKIDSFPLDKYDRIAVYLLAE
ncbi:MAG: helix-hairpin-helix domain-containing protein [Lutimonas sp.]